MNENDAVQAPTRCPGCGTPLGGPDGNSRGVRPLHLAFVCVACHLDVRPCTMPVECKEAGVCMGRNPACAVVVQITRSEITSKRNELLGSRMTQIIVQQDLAASSPSHTWVASVNNDYTGWGATREEAIGTLIRAYGMRWNLEVKEVAPGRSQ